MANLSVVPKSLAFRHMYVSSVVKENTVTLFGEEGTPFEKGTDYDAEVIYNIPSSELSNLVNYYSGGILNGLIVLPNGSPGSVDMTSLLSVNAAATTASIKVYDDGYLGVGTTTLDPNNGQYLLGDIVLFNPDPTKSQNLDALSCWTCIRTTSSPNDPLPLKGSIAPSRIDKWALPGDSTKFSGFFGRDKNSQNFIQGVLPAYYYDPVTKSVIKDDPSLYPLAELKFRSDYWKESAIARTYSSQGLYYRGDLVVFNGGIYECISTQGTKPTPNLYLNSSPASITQIISVSASLAPNGAYGIDYTGTRYIMRVPPSGGAFSDIFWKPTTVKKMPSTVYANVNWTNVTINQKVRQYDGDVIGGDRAQTIPSFTDDVNSDIITLRKIYDDNEKGFLLDVANSILARLPAAVIKRQEIGQKPVPDSSLEEMVLAGPYRTYPDNYSPAVQGVFEEAAFNDMLQVKGIPTTITEFVISRGGEGYFQDGSTGLPSITLQEVVGGRPVLATNPAACTDSLSDNLFGKFGVSSVFVDKSKSSYVSDTTVYKVGDSLIFTPKERENVFFIQATAVVNGVSPSGKILSVTITEPGSGYIGVPTVKYQGTLKDYLVAKMKLVEVGIAYDRSDVNTRENDTWGFLNGETMQVLHGSGRGAVAVAIVESNLASNGKYTNQLIGVTFNGVGATGGEGYISTDYKKDLVLLRKVSGGIITKIPAQVTKVSTDKGILEVQLIKNGCGYLNAPIVRIDRPPRELADLVVVSQPGTTGVTMGYTFTDASLVGIANGGKYKLTNSTGTAQPPEAYVRNITSLTGSIEPYLGLNYVEILYGGIGFTKDETLDVVGTVTPAVFEVNSSSSGGTFYTLASTLGTTGVTLTVIAGGSGYEKDKYITLDGPTAGANLVCQISKVGGNATSLSFSSRDLCGVSFTKNSLVQLEGAIPLRSGGETGSALTAYITEVGLQGQLYDAFQFNGVSQVVSDQNPYTTIDGSGFAFTGYTGETYSVSQTYEAVPVYDVIDNVVVTRTGASYNSIPSISFSAPTGTIGTTTAWGGQSAPFATVQATGVAVMGLNAIGLTLAVSTSKGFSNGDFVFLEQVYNGVTARAQSVVLQTDSNGKILAMGVEGEGAGFDPSLLSGITYTTSGEGSAVDGTTSGSTFNGLFDPSFTVVRVDITNKGLGYENPTVDAIVPTKGITQTLVVSSSTSGSGGRFLLDGFNDNNKLFQSKLVERGNGYIRGDLIQFRSPFQEGVTYKTGGLYTTVKTTVGGNILAANLTENGTVQGTNYALDTYRLRIGGSTLSANLPPEFSFFRLIFQVSDVGDTSSISELKVLESKGVYDTNDLFTHKSKGVIKVESVDRTGKILSLSVDNPGYGYIGLPKVLPSITSTGKGSLFNVPYLSVTRLENNYIHNGATFMVEDVNVFPEPPPLPAVVYATLPGDLHPISVDLFKNPAILDTLEGIKPGSTTGYAQGKATLKVQSIRVKTIGRNLGNLSNIVVNISAPELSSDKGGKQATAVVNSAGWDAELQAILDVTVTEEGSGYLKAPIITVTTALTDFPPLLVAQMAVEGVLVTSRGLGFGDAPTVTFSQSDVTPGVAVTGTATLRKSITEFNVKESGAHYTEQPEIRILSEGKGAEGSLRMGVTDFEVVDGGKGFVEGDLLEFAIFGSSGTIFFDPAGNTFVSLLPFPTDTHPIVPSVVKAYVTGVTGQDGTITKVVINDNLWEPTVDKYGVNQRVKAKNSIFHSGLGYGGYTGSTGGTEYGLSTLPLFNKCYRGTTYTDEYLQPGVTLASKAPLPWFNTNGTIVGATGGITYFNELEGLTSSNLVGITLFKAAGTYGQFVIPKIDCRLGVREFNISSGGEGFVNDAQILVDKPPQSQQARFIATVNPTTKVVNGFTKQSGGLGYTTQPKVSVLGGGGSGALATASMSIGEVVILDGGFGYEVGDVVNFPPGDIAGSVAASGVITVIDGSNISRGKLGDIQFKGATGTASVVQFSPGVYGITGFGIDDSVSQILNVGYGYKKDEEIEASPQDPLKSIKAEGTDRVDDSRFSFLFSFKKSGSDFFIDLAEGTLYTYGDYVYQGPMFDFPLGYVFGLQFKYLGYEDVVPYPLIQVNSVIAWQEGYDQQVVTLYKHDGTLSITPSQLQFLNKVGGIKGFPTPTGMGTPDLFGTYLDNIDMKYRDAHKMSDEELEKFPKFTEVSPYNAEGPAFRFVGWSDGDPSGIDRPGYGLRGGNVTSNGQVVITFDPSYPWPQYMKNFSAIIHPKVNPAKFKITTINSQQNGISTYTVLQPGSGSFYGAEYVLEGSQGGSISYVNLVNNGSGYTKIPSMKDITVTKYDGSSSTGSKALFLPTLSVKELLVSSGGALYFQSPTVYIDAPLFRSLRPQLYARSATIKDYGTPFTLTNGVTGSIEVVEAGSGYFKGGEYEFVLSDEQQGGLHVDGNASNSIDTRILLGGITTGPTGTAVTISTPGTSLPLIQESTYKIKGSNYRLNEVYKLMPIGITPSTTTTALVKVKELDKKLDIVNTQLSGAGYNDYYGILDYGVTFNGEDVGGYGTGYVSVPKFRIAGGPQGFAVSASLGLNSVDFKDKQRGTNYSVGDEVWVDSEQSGSKRIGKVSKVADVSDQNGTRSGVIASIELFTPYETGFNTLPDLSVVRINGLTGTDATLVPVLGVTDLTTVSVTDGFIGNAFIETTMPTGLGYVVQRKAAEIIETAYFMVDKVDVNPTGQTTSTILYEKAPVVNFEVPPLIDTFSGWNGVHFAPGDSFEFVIQYTIAKAVAFQVDPDVTLPGKYVAAQSITIGGVTIPLRPPGAASSTGREMSSNRVVYKYLVKFVAV